MNGCTHHATSANETAPLNNQSTTKLVCYPSKTLKLRSEPVQVVFVYFLGAAVEDGRCAGAALFNADLR
jgi:hypothetical protein